MAKVILSVPDISCDHCKRSIVNALQPQAGVADVQVDVPTKKVRLDYDPSKITLEQVSAILDDEGYQVSSSQPA